MAFNTSASRLIASRSLLFTLRNLKVAGFSPTELRISRMGNAVCRCSTPNARSWHKTINARNRSGNVEGSLQRNTKCHVHRSNGESATTHQSPWLAPFQRALLLAIVVFAHEKSRRKIIYLALVLPTYGVRMRNEWGKKKSMLSA